MSDCRCEVDYLDPECTNLDHTSPPRMVAVTRTTAMMLDLLQEKLDAEPTAPDLDYHQGHHLEEIARAHDQWQREVNAFRLLCGVRLVNEALA